MRHIVMFAIGSAACGRVHFDPLPTSSLDAAPCTAFGPWQAPVLISELATAGNDWGPAVSPDGLDIYYHSDFADGLPHLYAATRTDPTAPFSAPVMLTVLDSAMGDRDPAVAANGTRLYFSSDRGRTEFDDEIYAADGSGTSFTPPQVIPELGSSIYGPWVSNDELEIYYSTAAFSTVAYSTRATTADPWGPAIPLTELPDSGYPGLSQDLLTIYFEQSPSISVATRASTSDPFSSIMTLDAIDAMFTDTSDPYLSHDGATLYFGAELPGRMDHDIYFVTRSCAD